MRKSLIIVGLFGTAFTLATAAFGCEYGTSKALNVEKAGAKNLPIEKALGNDAMPKEKNPPWARLS